MIIINVPINLGTKRQYMSMLNCMSQLPSLSIWHVYCPVMHRLYSGRARYVVQCTVSTIGRTKLVLVQLRKRKSNVDRKRVITSTKRNKVYKSGHAQFMEAFEWHAILPRTDRLAVRQETKRCPYTELWLGQQRIQNHHPSNSTTNYSIITLHVVCILYCSWARYQKIVLNSHRVTLLVM